MTRDVARAGAVAGWLLLAGILILEVAIPTAIAGQQLSGTDDMAAVAARYGHDELRLTVAGTFLLLIPLVVFAVALRETLATVDGARFLATVGLGFMLVEAPLIAVETALQGTLVTIATTGGDLLATFRLWDLVYNGSVYAVEAGVVVAFGLAARGHAAFPRWLPAFALVVGALQIVNIGAVFGWFPSGVTLLGNLGFAGWLAASSFGLSRAARSGWATRSAAAAAPVAGA